MNSEFHYKIRGVTYQLACLNPFRTTILAKRLPLGLELQGYKRDAVGRSLYRRGVHEPGLTNFLLSNFAGASQPNFIDVGGNIGYFSCLFSKLAGPAGKVLAFEPESKNFALLKRNVQGNRLTNVELHECALGASAGTAKLGLYKPANRGRHSMVDTNVKSTVDVPIRRLDDVIAESGYGDRSWSLMKIDVEGYEPFVLQGAEHTLSKTEMLVLEYSPHLWKQAGFDPASVFDALSSHFSRVDAIRNDGLVEISPQNCARSETQIDLLLRRRIG
jgi:FkbM family methyltransferase